MRAQRADKSPRGRAGKSTSEIGLEILANRSARRYGAGVSGAGRHRDHVVARDVGRTRQAARKARDRFQCVAVRLPDRADLQGQLHRDGDGGDLRIPFAKPARHRSGQRDRDRNHDGGKGRDLSGLRIDARSVGAVLAGGLSAGRDRLLFRCRRQHAVVPVQRLDADPLLQQGSVPRRGPRSGGARRRPGPRSAPRRSVCAQPVRLAGSPHPGPPGSMSRIFPRSTICRWQPAPMALAGWIRN